MSEDIFVLVVVTRASVVTLLFRCCCSWSR
jgi:hypothetical protein